MKVSAKIDYACRALTELSLHWPAKTPLQICHIADRQGIPIQFLTQILIHLKQLGYVQSTRGKCGGYTLVRPPADIRLSEVIANFGGLGLIQNEDGQHPRKVLESIWSEMNQMLLNRLHQIHFEDIAQRYRAQSPALTFDI